MSSLTGPHPCAGDPGAELWAPGGVSREQSETIPALTLLATLLWMQPRMQVAFWPASAHGRLTVRFSATSTSETSPSELLSARALGLVEVQEVRTGPPLEPVQVPLDGIQRHGRLHFRTGAVQS